MKRKREEEGEKGEKGEEPNRTESNRIEPNRTESNRFEGEEGGEGEPQSCLPCVAEDLVECWRVGG